MAKKFQFSIIAKFRDTASAKFRLMMRRMRGGLRAGLLGGFAGVGGGALGGLMGRMAAKPGGIGGFLSSITQGAASVMLLPARILGAFAGLIPGVGGIISGVVGTAANVLQGLVGVAANVVGGIVNAFGKLLGALTKLFSRIISRAAAIFGKLAKYGTIAFTTVTVLGLRSFAKIEKGWTEVTTIMSGATRAVREKVRDLADEMGIKATAAIEAFYQAASQGFDKPAQALKVLRESAKIAIATVAELPLVLSTVTGALNAYKWSVEKAADVGDIFFIGIKRGKMRMTELAAGLATSIGVAAMAKIKLEELVSFFAVGTQRAQLPIRMLATGVRAMVTSLMKPMEESAKLLQRFGLTFKDLQRLGLVAYLQRLIAVTRGEPELLAQLFPQRRALISAIIPMVQYSDQVGHLTEEMAKRGGEIESAWSKMMTTLIKRWERFWGVLKRTAETFTEPLTGPVKISLDAITAKLTEMRPKVQAWGEAFAGVVNRIKGALSGREWSLGNFKTAIESIPGVVREQWENVKVVVSNGLKIIQSLAMDLVDTVASYLSEKFNRILKRLASSLTGVAAKGLASVGEPKGVPFKKRDWLNPMKYVERLSHLIGMMTPMEAALFNAYKGLAAFAGGLDEVSSNMRTLAETAPGREEEARRRERAAAAAAMKGPAAQMAGAARGIAETAAPAAAMKGPAAQMAGAAKGVAGAAAPKTAAAAAVSVAPKEWPSVAGLRREAEGREAFAVELRRAGYEEKAEAVAEEARLLREDLQVWMQTQAAYQQKTAEQLSEMRRLVREHDRRLKRLATARTG